jgi:hypothetical protein
MCLNKSKNILFSSMHRWVLTQGGISVNLSANAMQVLGGKKSSQLTTLCHSPTRAGQVDIIFTPHSSLILS